MDLDGLELLKQRIADAKDFTEPFEYFLDHFGENEEFLALGKRVAHPVLEAAISAVAGNFITRGEPRIDKLVMIRIPKRSFIHGICFINGMPGNFVYFEDVQIGLLAMLPVFPGAETRIHRFSARELPPGWVPSGN